MLDGINPDGLGEWTTLAGYILGTAMVLLMVAGAAGGGLAVWGKSLLSQQAMRRGWSMVALAGVGAAVLGGAGAAMAWGSNLGTSELMPAGARPGTVTVEKEAPRQSCPGLAVRDFDAEQPSPSLDEIKRVLSAVTKDQFTLAGELVDTAVAPGQVSVDSLKWHPYGSDCTAENESTKNCAEVQVVTTQMLNGADGKMRRHTATQTIKAGTNCA